VDNTPPDIKEYKGLKIDDNLLRQLQKMFGFLEMTDRQAYDPLEFCFSYKDFDGSPTNTAEQKDSNEFLNIFFERLESLLRPTSQRYLLDGVFGGKLCSQMVCKSCGHIRNVFESFFNMSLPVKDRKSLEESLAKMVEGEIINEYECSNCEQRVDLVRRQLVADTPNVLIVHLQRFTFNFDTFQNDKINTRFEFPFVLDLKPYSFKNVIGDDQADEDEEVKKASELEDDCFVYKLVGVVIHKGTADRGHYFSLINTKRGDEEADSDSADWLETKGDPWKQFDDSNIRSYSMDAFKPDAFGGSQGSINDDEMSAFLAQNDTQSYG